MLQNATRGSALFRSYNRMVENLIASRWCGDDSFSDGVLRKLQSLVENSVAPLMFVDPLRSVNTSPRSDL